MPRPATGQVVEKAGARDTLRAIEPADAILRDLGTLERDWRRYKDKHLEKRAVLANPPAHMASLAAGVEEMLRMRHPGQAWTVEVLAEAWIREHVDRGLAFARNAGRVEETRERRPNRAGRMQEQVVLRIKPKLHDSPEAA